MELSDDSVIAEIRDESGKITECDVEIPSVEVLYNDAGSEITDQITRGVIEIESNNQRFSIMSVIDVLFLGILIAVLIFSFTKRGSGGGFTKSRAKLQSGRCDVTFKDVYKRQAHL